MKVSQKKLGENKIRLEAVASAAEVDSALQAAQIAFAQSMGLLPEKGKTVAQIAEEKLGIKNLDSVVEPSALEELVPYALDRKNVVPAFPPHIEAKSPFKRGREFSFRLDVDLKPDYELTSYDPVEITVRPFSFDERLVDQQLSELAENYTMYVPAEAKPVEKGDSCLIAMKCFENGKELKNLSTEGRTYTTGGGFMPDGFDENIIGMSPGETKTFTFEGPSIDENGNEITQVVECTATVLEIQKPEKPVIDDAWVEKNMPFYKNADEMRQTIRKSLVKRAEEEYDSYKMILAATELAKRFQGSIPDKVYESMRSTLLSNIRADLQQQNKTWEQFVAENGGEQQLGMMIMMQAREMLVRGYALDAVFRHEHLVLSDEDIEAVCKAMNPQMSPRQVRQQMEQGGRGFVMRESAERLKANRWVLDHAIVHTIGEEEK